MRAGRAHPFTSVGYNVDRGTSCGLLTTGDIQNADAAPEPFNANGGFTPTRALPLGTNPAVDRDTAA